MLHSDSGKFMIYSGGKQDSLKPCKGHETHFPVYFVVYLWISRIDARLHHVMPSNINIPQQRIL
jgi:hypothetical protein